MSMHYLNTNALNTCIWHGNENVSLAKLCMRKEGIKFESGCFYYRAT